MQDVIVIGGSYAGMAAALQLLRARRKVLIIDAGERRNRFASHSHGFLGQNGVDPAVIHANARNQLTAYPTLKWIEGRVIAASGRKDDFVVETAGGTQHRGRRLLFATGVRDELPSVPGLADRWGRSVFHCPYCHGYELDQGRIGVIGTGPMSVHQAQLLPEWGKTTLFTNGVTPLDAEAEADLGRRGVTLERQLIAEIEAEAEVVLTDGRRLNFAGLFTAPRCTPASDLAAKMGCRLIETPMGLQIATGETKETDLPGVFACGDAARVPHSVSLAVGDGAWAGHSSTARWSGPKADRCDFAGSIFKEATMTDTDPRTHWDEIYRTKRSTSSGQPSKLLVQIAEGLTPGRSLDLGSSNGDDVVWLATQGWHALGVDISGVACERATARAASLGLQDCARFEARDLGQGLPEGPFDLITALYFQSHVDLPRARVLREAAGRVAPGGHLLIVSHAAPPPWASAEMLAKADPFPTVEEELEVIADAPEDWIIRKAEKVSRSGKSPDGAPAELWDNLIWLERCRA